MSTSKPELIAYVHNLSPVRRNRKNTMDYSTLRLQLDEKDASKEALCFSKTKRKLLVEKEAARSPIKLTKYTYTADMQKIIINDFTQVAPVNEIEQSFQYRENKLEYTLSTLEGVKEEGNEEENFSVVAKIVRLPPAKTVGKEKEWKVANANVADCTGSIEMEFWNDFIELVSIGDCYRFNNFRKRIWNGVPKLTTTHNSEILPNPEGDEVFKDIEIEDEGIVSNSLN